jgi:hypothetical protein
MRRIRASLDLLSAVSVLAVVVMMHGCGGGNLAFAQGMPAAGEAVPPAPAPARPGMDRKLIGVTALHFGLAMLDVAATQHCIRDGHCREGNPIMPSSAWGSAAAASANVAFGFGVSFWLRRRGDGRWWVPPAAGIGAHAVGIATALAHW